MIGKLDGFVAFSSNNHKFCFEGSMSHHINSIPQVSLNVT